MKIPAFLVRRPCEILIQISNTGTTYASAISRKVGIPHSVTVNQIDKLQDCGLLIKTINGKDVSISLTEKGKLVAKNLKEIIWSLG